MQQRNVVSVRFGCFYELGVQVLGVLVLRALIFGVYTTAPDFRTLPLKGGFYAFDKSQLRGCSLATCSGWVAVKEFKLSYHNPETISNFYISLVW